MCGFDRFSTISYVCISTQTYISYFCFMHEFLDRNLKIIIPYWFSCLLVFISWHRCRLNIPVKYFILTSDCLMIVAANYLDPGIFVDKIGCSTSPVVKLKVGQEFVRKGEKWLSLFVTFYASETEMKIFHILIITCFGRANVSYLVITLHASQMHHSQT